MVSRTQELVTFLFLSAENVEHLAIIGPLFGQCKLLFMKKKYQTCICTSSSIYLWGLRVVYTNNFPAIHMSNNATCDVIHHVLWFLYFKPLTGNQKGSQGNVILVTFQGCDFDFLMKHSFVTLCLKYWLSYLFWGNTWSQLNFFDLTKVNEWMNGIFTSFQCLWMFKSVKKKNPNNPQ